MIARGRHADPALLRLQAALLGVSLALALLGVLFIHSTSHQGEPFPSAAARGQIVKGALALALLFLVSRFDYRTLHRHAYLIYGGLGGVLLLMCFYKLRAGGINRFIEFRSFQIQPSELMKIGLVLCLARYLQFREDQRRMHGLLAPFLLTLLPMGLVLLQPDLGTSLMFPPMLLAMLFVAGAKRRHLLLALAFGLLTLPGAYFLGERLPLLHGYQRDRLAAFLHRDEATARTLGFHLRQSEIAIGSGGFWGQGYCEGDQNVLDHLPAKHTDFIFSVIAEELGFVGAALAVLCFCALPLLMFRVAFFTREPFGRLVAAGIGAGFAAQSIENLGMTMGLTPITGIPLPFVSFGGSSLVTSFLALGIVLNIAARRVRVVAPRDLDPQDHVKSVPLAETKSAALLWHRWPVE